MISPSIQSAGDVSETESDDDSLGQACEGNGIAASKAKRASRADNQRALSFLGVSSSESNHVIAKCAGALCCRDMSACTRA